MYIQGFSHWSKWGESPPPPSKNLLIPTHLEKFPPSRPLSQIFIPPPPSPLSNKVQVITQ